MACYISSNANRFYTGLEAEYGKAVAAAAAQRSNGIRLAIEHRFEKLQRRDKTGTRSAGATDPVSREQTQFRYESYLHGLGPQGPSNGLGPLVQAALGGTPLTFAGGALAQAAAGTQLKFAAAHGLQPGQALAYGGEMRFVAAVVDTTTVVLQAPFKTAPPLGALIGGAWTYVLADELPSASVYDYWSPQTAVQRLLAGCGVDELQIKVNGDFHEAAFQGMASLLVDSATFETGQAGLTQYPAEPVVSAPATSPISGYLGQVWVGAEASQVHTLTQATITLKNNLDTRSREFGSSVARCLAAGTRNVEADLTVYAQDNTTLKTLYQAARRRLPTPVMIQLGEQSGALCGIYLQGLAPATPKFDDSENRLMWRFDNSQARGGNNDELYIAFA